MDKQLVAERLSVLTGVRVSVGLDRRIEDIRDEAGRIVAQIIHDLGEKFTRADGQTIEQATIDEALAWCEANPPPPPEPTPEEIEREALRAKLTADDLVEARKRLLAARSP